jgi:gliding motility-associated protein GldC
LKRKEIKFTVEQNEQNIPEKIYWEASDNPNEGLDETRAFVVGVWDQFHRGTMFIPLWTNEMEVFDMKRMCIEMVGLLSDTVKTATGDELMAQEMDDLAARLSRRLREEIKAANQTN